MEESPVIDSKDGDAFITNTKRAIESQPSALVNVESYVPLSVNTNSFQV